jgi:hypothetical protein
LLPLAELLQAGVNGDYYEGEEIALVQKAMASPGPALIAWKHLSMQTIANAILGDATTAPQSWPFERVDVVWIFDRRDEGWTFTQVPELLLAGDRAEPIG